MTLLSVLVGCCYTTFTCLLFGLNATLLFTLLKYKEYQTSSYRIIKTMCVSSMIQLTSLIVGGVMTAAQTVFHPYLDRVLGVVLQSSWFFYVGLSFTLALDRLLIFLCSKSSKFNYIATVALAVSWLFWITVAVVLSLPGCGHTYQNLLLWINSDHECSQMLGVIEPYFDLSVFALILIIYLVVFGYLLKLKRTRTTQTNMLHAEMRIFLVACISFIYESLFVMSTYWILTSDTVDTKIVLNTLWIVDCGLFSSVTLVISGTLRRKMTKIVFVRETITCVSNLKH